MSNFQLSYCIKLLRESFGDPAKEVTLCLLTKGPLSLKLVADYTNIPHDLVKKSLSVLIQHNIVEFGPGKKWPIEYWSKVSLVLARQRFPYYIYLAKTLYGDEAEILVEELLLQGQMHFSELGLKVKQRLAKLPPEKHTSYEKLREKFEILAQTHFVHRCPVVEEGQERAALPKFVIPVSTSYDVPYVNFYELEKKYQEKPEGDNDPPKAKKRKFHESSELPDQRIVWQVSTERFDQYLRDQEIVKAASRKTDMRGAEVIRTMLRLCEVRDHSLATAGSSISSHEVFQALPKELGLHRTAFDQYLRILTDTMPDFITKTGDSGGGTYAINFKKAFACLATAHMESTIQERFGSKSLRIVRLLMSKKHVESKQIEQLAMLSSKECGELLFRMLGEGFITMSEVSKTSDYTPFRTVFLFRVNPNQVIRLLVQSAFQALCNLVSKREHEVNTHKRLLEKQQRLEMVVASLEQQGVAGEAQRAEVENTLTISERHQLTAVQHMTKKIEKAELQMVPLLFVLETHLTYSKMV